MSLIKILSIRTSYAYYVDKQRDLEMLLMIMMSSVIIIIVIAVLLLSTDDTDSEVQ